MLRLLRISDCYRECLFGRAYLMLDSVVPSSSLMHAAGMIRPGDANVPIASVQSTGPKAIDPVLSRETCFNSEPRDRNRAIPTDDCSLGGYDHSILEGDLAHRGQ